MRVSALVGFILILIGAFFLAYDGYSYMREVRLEQGVGHSLLFSPILSLVVLSGGLLLIIFGKPRQ